MEGLGARPAYVGLSRVRKYDNAAAEQGEIDDIGARLDPAVRSLLDELGILHACASAFDKEKVDLAALAGLADGNLQALGVVRLGDRRGLKVRAQALLASTKGWSGLGEEKPGLRDADTGDPLPPSDTHIPGKVAVQNWADMTGTEMHQKDENRPEEPAFTTVRRSGVDYRDPPLPVPEPVEHKRVEGVEEEFGKPTNNWGDWEEDKGRYQGEWKGGEFHGQGTYVWRSGVRYDGEWYRGKPHGIGRWSFDRRGEGKRLSELVKPKPYTYTNQEAVATVQASGYDVNVHPEGLPESMLEDSGGGRARRRRGVDPEQIARMARVWWPVLSKSIGDGVSSDVAHKFFMRVLGPGSRVRVLASLDLPHGWGRVKKPTLQRELWCHDPDRVLSMRRGDDECLAVVRLFFSSDFDPNPSPTAPRGDDGELLDAQVSFTMGVTKRLSMWDKCTALNNLDDIGALRVPIPQPPQGQPRRTKWVWRQEACCGFEAGCVEKPKCSIEKEVEADAPLCVTCASSSALKRLMEMAEQCRRAVRGVALPLSSLEYEDLSRLRRSALVICGEPAGSDAYTDAQALRESCESLRWTTQMTTQASRFDLEHAIIDFCEGLPALKGACMVAYIGKGIRLGDGSTHIIPSGVTLPETKFKLNDEDWEEAVRGMCLPVSWIEGQLAMVRGSDDRPGLILLDFSIGASPFAGRVPSAKPWKGPHIRSPNTGIITYDPLGAEVEVFRERQAKGLASGPVPAQPKVGGKTLVRTVLDLMMERGQGIHKMLVRAAASMEATRPPESVGFPLTCDYTSMCEHFSFQPEEPPPPLPVPEGVPAPKRVGVNVAEMRAADMAEVVAFHIAYRVPLHCNLPYAAIAGDVDMQPRMVRLVSLAGREGDCASYLRARLADGPGEGKGGGIGTAVICGQPATGKSHLAWQAAHERLWGKGGGGGGVFSIRCSDKQMMHADTANLARYLGLLDDGDTRPSSLVARLRRWLEENRGWFLVLDDARDPSVLNALKLPKCGSILITAPDVSGWDAAVGWQNTVEVESFDPREAHAFVLRVLPDSVPSYVTPLVAPLRFLPLSVSLAVSMLGEFEMKIEKLTQLFLAELYKQEPRLFTVHQHDEGDAPMTQAEKEKNAPKLTDPRGTDVSPLAGLRALVSVLLKELRERAAVAVNFLEAASIAHRGGIRRSDLQNHPIEARVLPNGKVLMTGPDWDTILSTLPQLVRLKALTLGVGGSHMIHPCIQDVILLQMQEMPGQGWGMLRRIMSTSMRDFGAADRTSYTRCTGYVPHIVASNLRRSYGGGGAADSEPGVGVGVLWRAGGYIACAECDLETAASVFDQLLEEVTLGVGSVQGPGAGGGYQAVAGVMWQQACVAQGQLKFEEALFTLENARVVLTKSSAHDGGVEKKGNGAASRHPGWKVLRAGEGVVLRALGRWEESEEALMEVLEEVKDEARRERERLMAEEEERHRKLDEEEAAAEAGGSRVAKEKEGMDDAHDAVKEESVLVDQGGPYGPWWARGVGGEAGVFRMLGDTRLDAGKWGDAAGAYLQGLEAATRDDLGEVERANLLLGVGAAKLGEECIEEAIEALDEAGELGRRAGVDGVLVEAGARRRRGEARLAQGMYAGAIEDLTMARSAYTVRLGKDSGEVGECCNSLGAVYDELDERESAKEYYEEALRVFRARKDAEGEARVKNNIGVMKRRGGDANGAMRSYAESIRVANRIRPGAGYGETVGAVRANLGVVRLEDGDIPGAMSVFEAEADNARKLDGPDSVAYADAQDNIASALCSQGRHVKALGAFAESYRAKLRAFGASHPSTARSLWSIGLVLLKVGNYEDATLRFDQALKVFERALGENHPDCASLLVDCGVALYGQGKYRMALLRLEAALKIRKAKSGARSKGVATILRMMGDVYVKFGESGNGIKWYDEALLIQDREMGKGHRETVTTLQALEVALVAHRDAASNQLHDAGVALDYEVIEIGVESFDDLVKTTAYNKMDVRQRYLARVQEKLDAVRLRLAGTAADGFVRSLAVYEKPRDGETRVRVKGLEEKGVHFNGRMGHVLGIVPGLKAEDKTRFRVRLDGGEEMNLLPQNVEGVGEARLRALELKPGRPVIIAGLKKSVEFNGMHAIIVRSANEGKKYVVSFDQAPAKKGARVKAEEDGKPLPAMSAPKEIKVSCECIDVIPPPGLEAGKRVKLFGLVRRQQYNGMVGTVISADWDDENRVVISLDAGGEIRARFDKVEVIGIDTFADFRPGRTVRIKKLANSPHLNGTLATVQWDEKMEEKGGGVGKIVVVLDSNGEEVRIAKDKCDLIPDGGGLAETLKRVRIHSLKQSSHLNGRFGTVREVEEARNGTRGRVVVILDGADKLEVRVKEANLDVI